MTAGGAAAPGKAARLRQHLDAGRLVRAVGCHNGMSAKLVEQAGFEAVWASSFELSASHCLPDASLLTMTQYLDAAADMDAVVALPVIADCDTGFGGPLNVAYAVRSYERRGIAAVCFEDQTFPKMNSLAATAHSLLPVEQFAAKIRAAKDAQAGDDLVVIARTEAFIAGLGLDEALRRADAYADAGADAVLVHSKSRRPEEVLEFAARWDRPVPLVAVPTTYPEVDERKLHEAGFGVVIYANHGMRAAIQGMRNALAELSRAGRADVIESRIAGMDEVFSLQGMSVPYRPTA